MVSQAQACRYEPSGYVQQVQESNFPIWLFNFLNPFLPPPFLFQMGCVRYHAMYSRVWQPLFTFLHLYFRTCSRDVGIYFPALCTCIVHDVCIYIPACPLQCECHSLCHLRQVIPNFCCERKVTCRQIFIVEIWNFARIPQESIDWDYTHSKA